MTYFSKPAHAAAWSVRDSISRITSVALPVALSIALLPLFTANVALAADANLAAGQINQTAVSDATVQTAQIEQVEEISTQVVEQLESSLRANMVLPYDPADIAAIGNQNESGHTICCPSYACAYADAVLDGTVNDHSYYTCSCCMWQDWGGGGSAATRRSCARPTTRFRQASRSSHTSAGNTVSIGLRLSATRT